MGVSISTAQRMRTLTEAKCSFATLSRRDNFPGSSWGLLGSLSSSLLSRYDETPIEGLWERR